MAHGSLVDPGRGRSCERRVWGGRPIGPEQGEEAGRGARSGLQSKPLLQAPSCSQRQARAVRTPVPGLRCYQPSASNASRHRSCGKRPPKLTSAARNRPAFATRCPNRPRRPPDHFRPHALCHALRLGPTISLSCTAFVFAALRYVWVLSGYGAVGCYVSVLL
jgi:hypothetical protein